ncbi:hypothetical protein LIER_23277 [Lithospermum erythrorhizon]|uniref:Myb/SANT-like domain-containing protein n=1 Tax=Lithospermum erythrorhizon TaxID=34254 RepID=A0AAV3QYE5_LITER
MIKIEGLLRSRVAGSGAAFPSTENVVQTRYFEDWVSFKQDFINSLSNSGFEWNNGLEATLDTIGFHDGSPQ